MSILECQRSHFDLPEDITYLNCAYFSPLHHEVAAACDAATELKRRPWEWTSEVFFDPVAECRHKAASLIGARAEEMVLAPSTSYVLATAAKNLPVGQGEKIVLLEEQFPSNYYCWVEKANHCGARVEAVAKPEAGGSWSEAVLAEIDSDTAVVSLPAVHWAEGIRFDLVAIAARARECGAAMVVDLSQSLGALPFSVEEVQPDFLVAAGYKWLLGPYGVAVGYVHPRWHEGQPLELNWIHRKGSEDFSRLVDYQGSFQPGARRFEVGQSSSLHQVAMLSAALGVVLNWGVGNIAQTLGRWTGSFCERAEQLGLTTASVEERSPHLIGVRFPKGLPDGLVGQLKEANVFVSSRGNSLRVAPYVYNRMSEVDRVIEVLSRFL